MPDLHAASSPTPPLSWFAVPRPRLVDQLDAGARHKVTCVTAPSGYGKTFLLADWFGRQHAHPTAWLPLDPSDDNPTRLARRLLGALGQISPDLGRAALERRADSATSLGSGFVDQLLVELATVPEATLVIDDLGAVANPDLVDELGRIITETPATFRVIVSAPAAGLVPPAAFAGDGTSVAASDLAFTTAEAATLLGTVSERALTDAHVSALVGRTEGWPAGLQLAALTLRTEPDIDGFIERFAGDDQHVAAYLTREVIAQQPAHVRRFLLLTSVLHALNGPLCDAVTGRSDSQQMLDLLQRGGLFTQRLSPGRNWLRYHGLFRGLLRHELRASDPGSERRLLRRAAEWHLGEQDIEVAANYLIEAEDWDRVLDLVDTHARGYYENGEAAIVVRWMEAVPDIILAERHLALKRAALHAAVGNYHVADRILHELRSRPISPGERVVANMLRATGIQTHVPAPAVIEAADDVLASLPDLAVEEVPDVLGLTSHDTMRLAAAGSRARALWLLGRPDDAQTALLALAEEAQGSPTYLVKAIGALALLDAWAGRLDRAEVEATRALELASDNGLRSHPATIDPTLAMATVLRERNLLGRAALALDEAHAHALRFHRDVPLGIVVNERALVHLAGARPDLGFSLIRECRANGVAPPPAVNARLFATEVRLLAAMGEHERAEELLRTDHSIRTAELAGLGVRMAMHRGDGAAARSVLTSWPDDPQPRWMLERELWESVVEHREGHRRQAVHRLAAAVQVAEQHGHVRLFLDAGTDVVRLLRLVGHEAPSEFLSALIEPPPAFVEGLHAHGDLLEPLSEREMQVVRFLPTRLSGAEIAAELFVSLNTLKTHLRSIYRKLGVSGRREAVELAERLGLA
jgi:LuxR family transcriptional regulator, maltose regulon positive regulatory protein